MFYHVFKKTITLKSGEISKRWYYYWKDPITNVQHQKICEGVKTQAEAYSYISKLKEPEQKIRPKIKDICKDMFLPESDHVKRLNMLGKNLMPRTLQNHRNFLSKIVELYGDMYIQDLTVQMVNGYLMTRTDKSGSWKNSFLETLGFVYNEAQWLTEETIVKPQFQRFARNTKKADILSTEELEVFFDGGYWEDFSIREYLLFFITACCGLRLGEARALRVNQIIPEKHALIVDGFLQDDLTRTSYNKKGSVEDTKLRVTIIPDNAQNLLIRYIRNNNLSNDSYLFTRENGELFTGPYCEYIFNKVLIKSGIDKAGRKICPHSLRYTFVTRMRREINAETVQKLAGHSSVEMTEYYTRASIPDMVDSVKEALPAVNRLFM